MATVVLPMALAVIMVGLGLELTVRDFKRVALEPRGAAIGLLNLIVISPLLAFVIAEIYSLPAGLAVGLVLLGTSPGGTTANLLTHLARGDTALSVTLTAISSVAAVITVPVFLELAIDRFGAEELTGDVGMLGIVLRVLLITVVPLAVGNVGAREPDRARRADRRPVQAHLDGDLRARRRRRDRSPRTTSSSTTSTTSRRRR